MDPRRFDDLVAAVAAGPSRRRLLRVLATGALTALGHPRGVAAKCKRDGNACKKDPDCCSGSCKGKKRKKRKCRTTLEAHGCSIDDPYSTSCPDRTNDSQFCWVTLGGKPFCGTALQCFPCASNQECVQEFSFTSARCVKVGPEAGCEAHNNRSCVIYP